MIHSISPLFSSPNLVGLDDWITGLGERAFLAWLRFHSWKDGQVSLQEPFLLPLSLNKVIQRLKIGKATFYNKILHPLLDCGLVKLQPASHTPREIHLLVYGLPEQTAQRKEDSSSPMNSTDELQDPPYQPCSASELPLVSTDDHRVASLPSQETPHTSTEKHLDHPPVHSINPLPLALQEIIQKDPRLFERKNSIIHSYHQCRKHPLFNEDDFQQKMQICISYPHEKHLFGAYLRKSLLNKWDHAPVTFPPAKKASTKSETSRPKDVPKWVFQQQERNRMNIAPPKNGLDPDQQAIIDGLLRDLGVLQ